ncbi:hypothetical protein RRG08_027770 [Elysia crispata]|uniref:Uncharacterized protein n=1 Tax=Elysia crispata TaxID=231223 RepID=A0AAE0Z984_9GAST|nr:hypothetical protein RRG08_027770 [Elysia crispata]
MNPVRTDMEKRLEEEGVQMKKERNPRHRYTGLLEPFIVYRMVLGRHLGSELPPSRRALDATKKRHLVYTSLPCSQSSLPPSVYRLAWVYS